jgi:hypothetical protein
MRRATVVRVMVAAALIVLIDAQMGLERLWLPLECAVLFGFYLVVLSLLKELSWKDLQPFAVWQGELPETGR